jgi:hypothetical protein
MMYVDADPRAIMCCTPTLRWLIVLTLPPRLPLYFQPDTGLSALAPAQRAGVHHNVLAIALANKLARIAWAVLNKRRDDRAGNDRGL